MEFRSVAEIARQWGVSERSVRNYCAQGRVPGARLIGKTWSIPTGARKPARAKARSAAPSPLLERLREEKAIGLKGGVYHRLQVDLAYNSNRIEGSRLSIDQTRLIFETATVGVEGESLRLDDLVETVNHFRALDLVIDEAGLPLDEPLITTLHAILKSGTSDASKPWFAVGAYKTRPNEVGGCETTKPDEVARELGALLREYEAARPHSFEEIVEFHVRFERIHPFQDGNGRVGRLIMLKECLQSGVVPFVVLDTMKGFYYRGLKEWDEERGYLLDTCRYAQDRFVEALEYFEIAY